MTELLLSALIGLACGSIPVTVVYMLIRKRLPSRAVLLFTIMYAAALLGTGACLVLPNILWQGDRDVNSYVAAASSCAAISALGALIFLLNRLPTETKENENE